MQLSLVIVNINYSNNYNVSDPRTSASVGLIR